MFLKKEVDSVRQEFNDRINGLAKKIECKVTDTIGKSTDSKLKQLQTQIEYKTRKIEDNVSKIARNVTHLEENIIPSENEKLGDEIDALTSRVKELESKCSSNDSNENNEVDRIVIRNLPERVNEDVQERICNLIKYGLKLSDIVVESAERKPSNSQNKPGVIIVTLKGDEDRRRIMANKSSLKNSDRYEKVFIETICHHISGR